MINIHERAAALMKPEEIDHWQSDLYLKVTPVSTALVEAYDFSNLVETFRDQMDDELWYEVPFAWIGDLYSGKSPFDENHM